MKRSSTCHPVNGVDELVQQALLLLVGTRVPHDGHVRPRRKAPANKRTQRQRPTHVPDRKRITKRDARDNRLQGGWRHCRGGQLRVSHVRATIHAHLAVAPILASGPLDRVVPIFLLGIKHRVPVAFGGPAPARILNHHGIASFGCHQREGRASKPLAIGGSLQKRRQRL